MTTDPADGTLDDIHDDRRNNAILLLQARAQIAVVRTRHPVEVVSLQTLRDRHTYGDARTDDDPDILCAAFRNPGGQKPTMVVAPHRGL